MNGYKWINIDPSLPCPKRLYIKDGSSVASLKWFWTTLGISFRVPLFVSLEMHNIIQQVLLASCIHTNCGSFVHTLKHPQHLLIGRLVVQSVAPLVCMPKYPWTKYLNPELSFPRCIHYSVIMWTSGSKCLSTEKKVLVGLCMNETCSRKSSWLKLNILTDQSSGTERFTCPLQIAWAT